MELFEIELIYIKMDFAVINLQRFKCHKTPTNQPISETEGREKQPKKSTA